MADNTIDSLKLQISANTGVAVRSLDRLADSLIKLKGSLNGINFGGLQDLSSGIRQMSNAMERFSGTVKTADFTRIATGLNKLSGVNVQGVSDASRAINTLTANISEIGRISFDSQGIANIANSIAQLGRNTVTAAADNIPKLTSGLKQLSAGLDGFQIKNVDFDSLAQLTSAITKLGGKSASTAASGNIDKLAVALRNMMTTLSTAPKVSQNIIQMTQALAQLASAGGKAGTATRSLSSGFLSFSSSSSKAAKSAGGLAAAFGKFYATWWLVIRGMNQFKKAIDISSALTEVQNVVDVTFGDMSDKMNEFADSALQLYGMSELMAKQIGSRFQAMGVSMGFAQDEMADMSIRLTQLAGDLSSFYNVSQDQIATALQSIFTGETEPLRRFGLDLSFATVEAWALAQGLDADMQSMTQAEKTMLRYQYVLANTGAATNDFIRTQNSWANQLRLLTGAFEQLGSIVGGVLVNAFKPFIQALNNVMGAVINFAQVVSDALGAIFGWEYQVGGGVANDYEAAAGAAEDLEDATGGAAKKAKELNRYIAAWHEVNNMTSNDGGSGGGSGGGGGAGGAGGAADGGEWIQKESLWEKYTSDIDSLYELGDYIQGVLTDAMNSIQWDDVYESARNFGSGLASFLNGLITPELFGATGRTIAGALNTALYAALSFGQTFEWDNLGESISSGINNFFATFDFASAADTYNTFAIGILDALISAIDNTDWDLIGTQIGTYLDGIDFTKIASKVGELLWKAINAGIKLWKSSFDAAPIETTIISALGLLKFTGLGTVLTNSIIRGITGKISLSGIGSAIAKALSATPIATAIAKAFSSNTIVATISATMAETGAALPTVLLNLIWVPLKTFFVTTLPGLVTGALSSLGSVFGLSGTAAIAAGGGLIVAAAVAAVAGIVAAVTHWDEIKEFFTKTLPEWWENSAIPFFQNIPEKLGDIWENVKIIASQKWGEFLSFMQNIPDKVSQIIASIGKWFSELPGKIGYELGYAMGTITDWALDVYAYLAKKIPETITAVQNWFAELPEKAYKAISGFFSKIQTWATETYNSFKTAVSNAVTAVQNWFSELPEKAYDAIIKIKSKIEQWGTQAIEFFRVEVPKIVDKVVEFFNALPDRMLEIGKNIVYGLWNGINGAVDWIGNKISEFCSGLLQGFRDGLDEHSPSKAAFEIGDYFTIGLGNGLVSRFNEIYSTVEDFGNSLSDMRFSSPILDLSIDTSQYQFKPTGIDPVQVQGKVQESLQYAFASSGIIDYNRLGQAVYQAQSQAMQENPVQLGDDQIFNSARRAQQRFLRRTGKIGWSGI